MKKETAHMVINELMNNELMNAPAVHNFFEQSDHKVLSNLSFVCNQLTDPDDDDSIEGTLTIWVALGTFERVDTKAIEEVTKQADKFKMAYMRFKIMHELLIDKALKSVKGYLKSYRKPSNHEERLVRSAQLFSIYLSLMLSSRFFTVYSAQ